jgi:Protein of unknown function (DUF2877)
MRLTAISAGEQAPRHHFNGAVHSVFRQACNLRADDGRLLALLLPNLGNLPHGVRVDPPAGFAFSSYLTAGQRFGCRADVIRITGAGLAIDLGPARPWRGEAAAGLDLSSAASTRARRVAWRTFRRHRTRDPRVRITARQGFALTRATRRFRSDQATRAIGALIGCGPGLTPAGDDLIVGFLAGLWSAVGSDPARRAFLERLCVVVDAAAAATGDISRAFLAQATKGRFAEPLAILTGRISEDAAAAEVERVTIAALRVGHTSGGDGVLGLLLGLAAWQRGDQAHG